MTSSLNTRYSVFNIRQKSLFCETLRIVIITFSVQNLPSILSKYSIKIIQLNYIRHYSCLVKNNSENIFQGNRTVEYLFTIPRAVIIILRVNSKRSGKFQRQNSSPHFLESPLRHSSTQIFSTTNFIRHKTVVNLGIVLRCNHAEECIFYT